MLRRIQRMLGARAFQTTAVYLLLFSLVWGVFGRSVGFDFVNYDDYQYLYDPPAVMKGLTGEGLRWVFTSAHLSNWHPLTTISYMLDVELFGKGAGGFHATNVLLHSLAAVFLFCALRALTGSFWRSAAVAALFAVHPLRAESVAWISERKDVLSGLFFALTLWAYARFARRPFAIGRYLAVAGCCAAGLLSKPTLTPLPVLLLVLDFWPLGRLGRVPLRRLVVEKVPLLLISAGLCGLYLHLQALGGEASPIMTRLPLGYRIGNAAVAYGVYLRQTLFPAGLCCFYPHPETALSVWKLAGAGAVLAGISAAAWLGRRRAPWLGAGWLWYLGMLVPVIGLVQVGDQAHADRYTYLPQIGLLMAGVWAVAEGSRRWRFRRAVLSGVSIAAVLALAAAAWVQSGHWKNSRAVWTRALTIGGGSGPVYNGMGGALLKEGRAAEALDCYDRSYKLNPQVDPAFVSQRASALFALQRYDEAFLWLQAATHADPKDVRALSELGTIMVIRRDFLRAKMLFERALKLDPEHHLSGNNLAWLLATGPDAALRDGRRAVELALRMPADDPKEQGARLDTLAAAYAEAGRFAEAVKTAEAAVAAAQRTGTTNDLPAMQERLRLYQAGRPYHEEGKD